jgi:hypothetical protein
VFFLIGYAGGRRPLHKGGQAHGAVCLLLGIVSFVSLIWAGAGEVHGLAEADYSPVCILFLCRGEPQHVVLIVLFLSLAARHLSKASRLLAYANEAVLPLRAAPDGDPGRRRHVVRWHAGIALKYTVIAATSFVLIMAAYELLVRRVNLLRVLFGCVFRPADSRPSNNRRQSVIASGSVRGPPR